jgi:GTP-binding protein
VDVEDVQAEYDALRSELEAYSESLARRPHCVVFTKMDLLGPEADPPSLAAPDAWGVFAVSSVARRGLSRLTEALWQRSRIPDSGESRNDGDEEWWAP